MSTISVLNSNGDPVLINEPLPPGRAAAASSNPVALSTEDSETLNGILAALIPGPSTVSAASIGVASSEILAADATRQIVMIQNVSATATIAARSGGAASLYAGGNFMAGALGYVYFQGEAAQAAIHAISDTASTPLTIGVG